jgi:hypothetical protein
MSKTKLNKDIDASKVNSIFTIPAPEEVLDFVADKCLEGVFQPAGQGWEGYGLIVLISCLEDIEPDDTSLKEILKIAKRAGCTYLHLVEED